MKTIAILIVGILFQVSVFAQNEMDALRYSQIIPGGTARFASMGGAFGALGGDFSSLGINPAGAGIYRSSELTISPSLNYSQVNSTYFNTRAEDMKYNFNLNNLGAVFAYPLNGSAAEGGWQFINFGLGINRHNNFNVRWMAEGYNTNNSFMTSMLEQANREGSVERLSDFSTGLAWDTYLLDIVDGEFFVDMPGGQVLQRQETNTSGSVRELVFSVGANYNDRVYLGATAAFPSVNYREDTNYREEDTEGLNEVFNAMRYATSLRTTGSGYNFKFGAIIRATDMIRIGGAFHTPTFYSLEDRYEATMRSDLNIDYDTDVAHSPVGRFDYRLTSPLKAIGSLGLVFGTSGILSLDYEYVDYTKARLRSGDYGFTDENRAIRENFSSQHNLRVGGEIVFSPLVLRAGYAFYSSPYAEGVNDGERSMISAGLGFRNPAYSLDFAYTHSFYSEDYYLYSLDGLRPVERDFSASTFRMTLGYRF